MAYCGAPTSKGGYCRNHAGRCPHHGIRAGTSRLVQSSIPAAPSATPSRSSPSGSFRRVAAAHSRALPSAGTPAANSSPWLTAGGNASAATLLFILAAIVVNVARLDTVGLLTVTVGSVALPLLIASSYWTLCGARNLLKPGRCHNRRRGPFVRCQHHDGVTLYDLMGLLWFIASVITALLFALPAIQSAIHT